ncbi:putative FKBP-type peptidyl-prolyl cis-trans isomerase [Monocercomonoides exilis]|uniref:putative FKBP-type peptidyl-prolyl cis-trans isomerase n=1 Tax=Monocercomonoides exilis TaxID=2049356 RepID=UPI00355AC633|nr:putative FKBP-type peptidyl-prolyl cis-trans isomerase [Monocercomonoides exilis]|eukprot:MONOS_28.1-p1 / transcript=MONOS_28.1 / gene=MONOS_28 / organism=Monocercomonoides_exilis_PA203 / gene_product=unspecified product / transcript_product=unspecified product / location=Mono_scaffold00001:76293-77027(+) / protein_length=171 / sequence_SO=supercontig / SO=protein_coding / is_pseudo=false
MKKIAYNLTLFTAKRRVDYTKPNESFIFKTGYSQTLDGLDQGVLGMCIGERRRILIPASLAYGMRGADDVVPGGCAIIMDVELLDMFPLEFDEEKADKFLKRRMELEERAKEGDWDEYLEPKPFDPLRYNLIRQVGGIMKRTYHAPPRPTLPRRVREKPRKKRPQLEDLEI